MKKTATCVLCALVLLLAACGEAQEGHGDRKTKNRVRLVRVQASPDSDERITVMFITGKYIGDRRWEENNNSDIGENNVIRDKEIALERAKQIFDALKKPEKAQSYAPQAIFFDEEDAVWIVSFWEPGEAWEVMGIPTLTGKCNIAIQTDGTVLGIWYND